MKRSGWLSVVALATVLCASCVGLRSPCFCAESEGAARNEYEQRLANDAARLENGDVILTRNLLPRQNLTPGYWNHAAIAVVLANGPAVVEMQSERGVIATSAVAFFRRYPEYVVLRGRVDFDRDRIGKDAWERVGKPFDYRPGASLPFRVDANAPIENCVSFVRRCYLSVGRDYRWRTPDCIFNGRFVDDFETITFADERKDWREPLIKWDGIIEKR